MSDPGQLAGHLTEAGHELLQRVYFEDTDFSGRVYHARYLHFLERGRSDYLRLLGIGHRELADAGLAFAVRRMEMDFLRAASIDDVLAIRTTPARVGGARIELRQRIECGVAKIAEARVTVALVGQSGRPARLPETVRAAFLAAGARGARGTPGTGVTT